MNGLRVNSDDVSSELVAALPVEIEIVVRLR